MNINITATEILLIVIALFLILISVQGLIFFLSSRKKKLEPNDRPEEPIRSDKTEMSSKYRNSRKNFSQGREFEVLHEPARQKESRANSYSTANQYEDVETVNIALHKAAIATDDLEQTQMLPRDGFMQSKRVILSCKSGSTEKRIEMRTATLNIGRDPTNDLVIPDDQFISRKHAQLSYTNGKLEVVNLSQKNVVVFQGQPIDKPLEITESTEITVGSTKIFITLMDV